MNEISHKINFLSTLYYNVFILTLFCFSQNVQSYHDKHAKCPQRKFTVKLCDSRYYRDSNRSKTNDKDRFQLSIREYICNAPI